MSLIARIVLVFVSTSLYFGLAILAGDGPAEFFSHPPLVALAPVTVAMAIAAVFAGGNISSGVREDRGNRWVLAVFTLAGFLIAFVPPYADHRDFWTFDGDAIRWTGVALFAVGGALRLWPVFVLGDRFSGLVAIQPGHTLVTSGIYRYIRNPSYLGLLITCLGWSLAFRSTIGLLITATLLPPLVARMHAEERCSTTNSEPNTTPTAHTWRLIPGIY